MKCDYTEQCSKIKKRSQCHVLPFSDQQIHVYTHLNPNKKCHHHHFTGDLLELLNLSESVCEIQDQKICVLLSGVSTQLSQNVNILWGKKKKGLQLCGIMEKKCKLSIVSKLLQISHAELFLCVVCCCNSINGN